MTDGHQSESLLEIVDLGFKGFIRVLGGVGDREVVQPEAAAVNLPRERWRCRADA
jgi:hypothetical protein